MRYASTEIRFPNLAVALARSGMTRTALGHRVDCGGEHISHIIRGHKKPSMALRCRIAEVLGQPEADLFAEAYPFVSS